MMGEVIKYEDYIKELRAKTLEELFEEAQQYGRVNLFESANSRTFRFTIKFESVPGTSMEAASDFRQKTVADAIIQAVARAKVMVGQFSR